MVLYTRKGDKGTTKVLDSRERFSKGSELAEALGSLDELNSFVGLAKAKSREAGVSVPCGVKKHILLPDALEEIQQNLFIVQAQLAGAKDKKFSKAKVTRVERYTDGIEGVIPPITGFSIAGGTELSALLDVTRTMARRAERRVIGVRETGIRKLPAATMQYLNRLSSYLFALARLVNFENNISEQRPHYK